MTTDVGGLAGMVTDLCRLALAFGRIDRTAVHHPDGTPESDTDHTVMLGWVACSLAARFPGLDIGLVAQFALAHDAPEVYAGDTPTLRIDATGRAAKADRERAATARLAVEFGMGWGELATMLARQGVDMAGYVGEFTELMALRAELARRVLDRLGAVTAG